MMKISSRIFYIYVVILYRELLTIINASNHVSYFYGLDFINLDVQTSIEETEKRMLEAFEKGLHYNPKIGITDQFLRQHISSKLKLVVLYIDLVDSTLMTRSLSVDKLATLMQIFTQEMSVAVSKFNGQILKYAGDAVIAYFPVNREYSLSCNTSIACAFYMIAILEKAINSKLIQHGFDALRVKIGVDTSEHSIIQYTLGENSYADILGYGISMAAKLTKLASPNQIIISHSIYIGLNAQLRRRFSEVELVPSIWKYIDEKIQPGVWKST
jgi:adenylate cyclase